VAVGVRLGDSEAFVALEVGEAGVLGAVLVALGVAGFLVGGHEAGEGDDRPGGGELDGRIEELDRAGVADSVIPEPVGGAQRDPEQLYQSMDRAISQALSSFRGMSPSEIREQRFEKYRAI